MANVYFGNLRKAVNLPAPKSGMEATAFGRVDKLALANGGSFVSQSAATHQEYEMAWGATEASLLNPLWDFRRGIHGSGLLYYCDPYLDNAMPPHWAEPALSGKGWPSLYAPGVDPTLSYAGLLRTNLAHNPAGTATALLDNQLGWSSRWFGSGVAGTNIEVSGASDGPPGTGITTYRRKRWDANAAGNGDTGFDLSRGTGIGGTDLRGFPVTPGDTITMSAYLRPISAGSKTGALSFVTRNAAGAFLAHVNDNPQPLTLNAWNRLSVIYTVPAGTTYISPILDVDGGVAWANGDMLDGTGFLVEKSATLNPYFDGSTKFIDGSGGTWLGAANATQSTLLTPVNGMPAQSATYPVTSPVTTTFPARAAVLLVPPTKTLWLGVSGSSVGGAGVYVRAIGVSGSIGAPQPLTLLSVTGTTRLNASFDGASVSAVIVYLDSPVATIGSSVTLNSATAIYTDTGTTPTLTGNHIPGGGHTGLRMQKDPIKTQIMQRGTKEFITAAISLTEVGAWL